MLTEQVVQGQRVILGGNGALVASKSQAPAWHVVRTIEGLRTCDCKGFRYRHGCSHTRAVAALEKEQAKQRERDTAILAGPAIDPPLFTERKPWKRPEPKSFEELFGQSA